MFLALLLLGIIPRDDVAREHVDLVEVNHFYDEQGRLVFDQVIFYDWGPPYKGPFPDDGHCKGEPIIADNWRYQVRAWRLVKNPNILPQRDWQRGGYVCGPWEDKDQMRVIKAAAIRETWTQEDPELYERRHMPKEKRWELILKPKPITVQPQPTDGHPVE